MEAAPTPAGDMTEVMDADGKASTRAIDEGWVRREPVDLSVTR
jgi:hypothetical protein